MNPYTFFEELKRNNNREWFARHKSEYEDIRSQWEAGVERVKALVVDEWPEVRFSPVKTFRIYRDTRFSTDKTPYKTHIGSILAPAESHNVHHPGVYMEVGVPTSDSGVFAGMWAPESAELKKLRRAIVDNIEEWEDIVKAPDLNRYYDDWYGERLKTAPKGWPKDHPQIEYLRLKHLGRQARMTRSMFLSERWPDEMARRIVAAVPLLRFLSYSLTEELT